MVFDGDSSQFVPWRGMGHGKALPISYAQPVVWITYLVLVPLRIPHDDGIGEYTGTWGTDTLNVPMSLN